MNSSQPLRYKIQNVVEHMASQSLYIELPSDQFGYKPLMCSQNIRPKSNKSKRCSTLQRKSDINFISTESQKQDQDLNYTCGNTFRYSRNKGKNNSDEKNFIKQLDLNGFLRNLYQQKAKDLKICNNKKQQNNFIQKFKGKISQQFFISTSSDLGLNSIKCICDYLITKNIKILRLDKNPIGDDGIIELSKLIPIIQLSQLSLVSVNIGQKSGKLLIKSIKGRSQLKIVNFSSAEGVNRNRFGKGICQFEGVLRDSKCGIQRLYLNSVNIGQQNLQSFSTGIKKQSTLQQLNLCDNQLKSKYIEQLYNKIKFTHIKVLNLSSNGLGDEGLRLLGQIIGTSYGYNSLSQKLQILNLSNNNIRSYGLQSFSRNMVHNQMLKQLDLSNNSLSEGERFFNFKLFIHRHWSIKHLNLQKCLTTTEDIKHLCEGLIQNRSLQYLNLSKTSLDLQSFQEIISMLSANKALKKIDLQHCNICDTFVQKCQNHIRSIKVLEALNLNNNYISDKGGKLLIQIFHTTKSITQVSLAKNCMGLKVIQIINDVLKHNKKRIQCNEQPDLRYFQYVEELQLNQQIVLKQTIQKIAQQGQKTQRTLYMYEIAQKEIQQQQKKKQIQAQLKKIKELQKIIEQKIKKSKRDQKDKTFCTS